jgi:hypothetical protein
MSNWKEIVGDVIGVVCLFVIGYGLLFVPLLFQ